MQSKNINKKGFAALYLLTVISFALVYLVLLTNEVSFKSRENFLYESSMKEAESSALSCIDLARFATQKGDWNKVINREFFLVNAKCKIETISQSDDTFEIKVRGESSAAIKKLCAKVTPSFYQACPA